MKNNFSTSILKIFIMWTIVIMIITLFFYNLTKLSITLGFAIGSCFSFISYQLKDLILMKSLLKIPKNKNKFNFFAFIGFMLIIIFAGVVIAIILLVNQNAKPFYNNDFLNKTLYPINIISFIFGATSLNYLTYFYNLILNIRERRKNGQDS
ncbi:hypothetical protein MM26B8_05630 [Mycoplasmopsis meleagridis]|nr:hypothetical protein [Mycoplasmopsis meleagridis]OAD18254.1 hypothetical protein MM26B8_05630 [Mycoplasmopsis meleagridis]VEU77685.1 Uncharacterised protein [Mycoplasmopsis meleagridis]